MPFIEPLEPSWKDVLDRVLRPLGHSIDDVARLAPRVAALSAAYNAGEAEGKKTKLPLEARIAFSFPRDVPKGAAAISELLQNETSLAVPSDRPLRILDLGAGLGAMTWGVVRALRTVHPGLAIDATLVDEDGDALKAAAAFAREAKLEITTRVGTVAQYADSKADIAILGQVLSELDPRGDAESRLTTQADLVRRLLVNVGTVIIVEPALRDRTRHLHALRDRVVAAGAHVHAPCLHSKACPALATEGDWCHDDLAAVDLPEWVAPLARAAGLRWQGLTFSYLVLRSEPPARPAAPALGVRFRVTSDLLRSKGKVELFACCESGQRPRIRRLQREGAELDGLERGDVATLTSTTPEGDEPAPPVDERGRIASHVSIDVTSRRN